MRAFTPVSLCSLSATAAAAFVAIAYQVATRRTASGDQTARDTIQESRKPSADALAQATNPLGKEWLHVPAAVALSLFVARYRRGPAALVPALASIASEVLSRAPDHLPPNRHPPPLHPNPRKECFPSGHALETTAVAGTSAYVLARENLIPAPAAFAGAAGLALASSGGRLYLDRHWISDAVGGITVGISVAAACSALYEISVRPRS